MTCEKMRENDDLSAFSDEDFDFVHENFRIGKCECGKCKFKARDV